MRRTIGALALTGVVASVFVAPGASTRHASTAAPIKIGLSQQLSGAIPLPAMTDSYKTAIAEINRAGGVLVDGQKRKLQLVIYDNRSDTNLMTQQVRKLVLQDKVSVLLGACCQVNIAEQALADALKVPFVACCIPLELMKPDKGGYSWVPFQRLGDAGVGFFKLLGTIPTNKKVVIVTNNDASNQATQAAWGGLAEQNGYTVAAKTLLPFGTTDFSDIINQAKQADAQVLVAAMVPPDCFALWKQMKALGYHPKVAIALQCGQAPGWSKGLGDVGNGTLAVQAWLEGAGLPLNKQIVAKFKKKWSDPAFLQETAAGYTAARIVIDAIRRAGSTNPQRINAALAKTNGNYPLGHIRFNASQQAVTTTFIGQWVGGKLVQVYPLGKGASKPVVPVAGLG